MWEVNERSAIAQEIVNDVMHDLENGDKIDEVGQRFGLTVKTPSPCSAAEALKAFRKIRWLSCFRKA